MDKPPVWQMVKEAVEALGSPTTNIAIRDWILQKYPGTNTNTIVCQSVLCTVNHPKRINYSTNKKPRSCISQYDFLYRPEKGKIEIYDPSRHGIWKIIESENGTLKVCKEDESLNENDEIGSCFPFESHLRDFLAQNLDVIEPGLQLFVDEPNDADGVEYKTKIGIIDILALDKDDNYVVIELKVARGPDFASGQLLRYMNWVKRELEPKRKVRGMIIAQNISDKIRYALADSENIILKEYDLQVKLWDIPSIDVEKPFQ